MRKALPPSCAVVMKSGNLNFLEPSGSLQACNGTALPLQKWTFLLFRPKRFTLKQPKQFWFTCRDLHLTLYKSREEAAQGADPVHHINLRGCEVTPEVNITQGRYGIKLEVPSAEGMTEMFIRCNTVSPVHITYYMITLFNLVVPTYTVR